MTISKTDREALIQRRTDKAREALNDAGFLASDGRGTAAVNRIYYAVFHALSALALRYSFSTSKHRQIIGWFNKEFVKSSDESIKFKFTLKDGEKIETVLIPEKKKATLCISTQVGCKFSCKICRTGQLGFKRNLTSGEIIEQIIEAKHYQNEEQKIRNLVFMGMGEPLDNFKNLKRALSVIIDKDGLDFSPRYITVSTVGYVPAILKFGQNFPAIGLAISLNAADNKIRNKIIPLNKKYTIEKILGTLKKYPLKPRKVITIEYVLIQNLNDSEEDAKKLSKILKGIRCKINLIPFNEFDSSPYTSSNRERIEKFRMILLNSGHTCITRKSRGQDIQAACCCLAGQ